MPRSAGQRQLHNGSGGLQVRLFGNKNLHITRSTKRSIIDLKFSKEYKQVGVRSGIVPVTGYLSQLYIGFGGLQVHVKLVENKQIHVDSLQGEIYKVS